MASAAVWWPPLGREPLPGRARTVATRPQRREGADSPSLPSRFHPRHRRSRSHGHRSPAFTLPPAAFESRLPPGGSAFGTFGAGRRRGDFRDSSRVPAHAQSRADIESSRARVPYIAGCEISPATVLRAAALANYSKCFRAAYGHNRSRAGVPRRSPTTKSLPRVGISPRLWTSLIVTSIADPKAATIRQFFRSRRSVRRDVTPRVPVPRLVRTCNRAIVSQLAARQCTTWQPRYWSSHRGPWSCAQPITTASHTLAQEPHRRRFRATYGPYTSRPGVSRQFRQPPGVSMSSGWASIPFTTQDPIPNAFPSTHRRTPPYSSPAHSLCSAYSPRNQRPTGIRT